LGSAGTAARAGDAAAHLHTTLSDTAAVDLLTAQSMPLALVTGASSGLGREFAEQLASSGFDLVLVSRDVERLERVAAELSSRHARQAEVLPADLAVDDDVTRVVERIDALPLDVLVNNAGFGLSGRLARMPRKPQDDMVRLHVLAAHRLTHAAVQGMVSRGHGTIINVSSVASFLTAPGNVNYSATKAYLRMYTEALAVELDGTGVYVQALCPGYTHTEFHQRMHSDKRRIPGWMWMNADRVVRESLTAMRRRRPVRVVPGLRYRLILLVFLRLPRAVFRALFRIRLGRRFTDSGRPRDSES
jgi:uncharacterized protein